MTDHEIEERMIAEYFIWLAFTADTPIQATPRWQVTQRACQGFANLRRQAAKA